ncbi:glycosyltransferase family 32 protein [Falsibacillus albus]|nr:glycosyltransferase [Falsibacillus albus]
MIHYCWFGHKNKPPLVEKCLNSWKYHLQDYQLIEWNETSININQNAYVKEAYESKKYAFVSDYVRVHALYHQGGIYLDTDVEVFKSFNDLLHHQSFWGFEQENFIATSTIGASPKNALIKMLLDSYKHKRFRREDGSLDSLTNVALITQILVNLGLIKNGEYQELEDIGVFYPQTYFSPYDYINCRNFMTSETYAMHHFHKSWLSKKEHVKGSLKYSLSKMVGGDNIAKIRKLLQKH